MILLPAYAKLNLALEVVGRRADGYHDLESVMVTIDWHDLVGVRLHPGPSDAAGPPPEAVPALAKPTGVRGEPGIALRLGPGADRGMPTDATNLAVRAAAALVGSTPARLALFLEKRVPSQAGLGGGSADAAAVLRALAPLLGVRSYEGERDLTDIAASIGSDVPFLLSGGAALARGRGQLLDRLPDPRLDLVVVHLAACSTAAVYAALEPRDLESTGRAQRVAAALRAGVMPADDDLGSALEAAAQRVTPRLSHHAAQLRAATPSARWHLTGSGGAVFAVAADAAAARALAAAARDAGFIARACRTTPAWPEPGRQPAQRPLRTPPQ